MLRTDEDVGGRTTINTLAYPAAAVPEEFAQGNCPTERGREGYESAIETFSQTFISAKATGNTEIGGAPFTSQTSLTRRADVTVDGVQGLLGTHDTYELFDNWNLGSSSTPWDIPYGDAERFFQQFYVFPKSVTIGPLTVAPCDLLHLVSANQPTPGHQHH